MQYSRPGEATHIAEGSFPDGWSSGYSPTITNVRLAPAMRLTIRTAGTGGPLIWREPCPYRSQFPKALSVAIAMISYLQISNVRGRAFRKSCAQIIDCRAPNFKYISKLFTIFKVYSDTLFFITLISISTLYIYKIPNLTYVKSQCFTYT